MKKYINNKKIDVVILAGGLGTRLRSIVSDRPKPMAEISGRPFLDYLIDHISNYGFKRIILCTGYLNDVIEKYYSYHHNDIEIVISKEKKPLNTGGAIKNAREFIISDPFLVMNGDSYCPIDLNNFLEFHFRRKALTTLTVVESRNNEQFGTVVLDEYQNVIKFEEKSHKIGKYINAGIYLFKQEVFSIMPPDDHFSLEYDLFTKLVEKKFCAFISNEQLIDIGTPENYQKAQNIII